jgi:large subunit ribosomal protein L30
LRRDAGAALRAVTGQENPMTKKTLKVTLVRSPNGTRSTHKATVLGLGLKRIRQTRELEDTPAVRGMITKVSYLVRVE